MTTKLALFSSAIAAAALCAPAAFAADATTTASAAAPTAEVSAIVVTARKREENLQQVPIAITAQTGKQLVQQSIRQPSDLSRVVPSLTIASGASSPTGAFAVLRGQSASDLLITFSQPVGFYEDSINIPHPAGTNIGFFDIDRVEIDNGPQGTLYGRNTTGGAINILTRGADYGGYHGFLYGEGGNFDDWKVGGAINLPIIEDQLALRIAYQHWNREGFGKSLVTGERYGGDKDDNVFRASLRVDPTPAFSITAKLEYVDADRTDELYQSRQVGPTAELEWQFEGMPGPADPATLAATTNNLFVNYSDQRTFEQLSAWHGVLDASWRINDNWSLRSLTGFHQFTDVRTFDLDAMNVVIDSVGASTNGIQLPAAAGGQDGRPLDPDQQSTQWTQEFDLSGKALDGRLNMLGGFFYSNDSGDSDERAVAFPALTGAEFAFHNPLVTNESYAVFTQEDFKINSIFSVTGGLRYTQENVGQIKQIYTFSFRPGPTITLCDQGPLAGTVVASPAACNFAQTGSSNGVSYLASLNAQVTPNVLLYLKTARGFRGEVLQIRADAPPAQPETATDYEVGMKSEWFEHRLRANLDFYDTEYANKQETQIIPGPGGSLITPVLNAASARVQGVEGQFQAVPFRGLTLNANFDYLHGVYTKFGDANCGTPAETPADKCAVAPAGNSVNATGVSFAYAPWSFDIGGRYEFDVGPGQLAFQADYSWRDALPRTVLSVDPAISPTLVNQWFGSVGLVNARAEYHLPEQGVTIAIFATNLADKHYQTASLGLPGGTYTGQTQEPRMYGISIRKSFGGGE
jgi:iron complex outermembrane receptor protein